MLICQNYNLLILAVSYVLKKTAIVVQFLNINTNFANKNQKWYET